MSPLKKIGDAAKAAFLAVAGKCVIEACENINSGQIDEACHLEWITHEGKPWQLEVRISPVEVLYANPTRGAA